MNPNERLEAVRLVLEIIERRRERKLTKEQAQELIAVLGIKVNAEALQ